MVSRTFPQIFIGTLFSMGFFCNLSIASSRVCSKGTESRLGVCQPCLPGTYKFGSSSKPCTKCYPGYFNPNTGSFDCFECQPGTFSPNAGATSCKVCPKGLKSITRAKKCLQCKPGQGPASDPTRCQLCYKGFYNDGSTFECKPCPPGTTSNKKRTKCIPCPMGRFSDYDGRPPITCSPCPESTYTASLRSIQCKLCPLGMTSERGATKCTSCPSGTYRSSPVISKCQPCPKGTSSLGIAPAGCKSETSNCPDNTFERDGECRSCLPGQRYVAETKSCVSCRENEISDGGNSPYCTTCGKNMWPEKARSVSEKARCVCREGFREVVVGSRSFGCIKCRPGSGWRYDYGPGSPPSLITRNVFRLYAGTPTDIGSSGCENCEQMSFQTVEDGVPRCKPCPYGTVSGIRATKCETCPKGLLPFIKAPDASFHSEDSTSFLTRCHSNESGCPLGMVLSKETGKCVKGKCPSGTVRQSNVCTECSPFQFYDEKSERCERCRRNTGNKGFHANLTCAPCSGEGPFKGGCTCSIDTLEVDGKCGKCPLGQFGVRGECRYGQCGSGSVPKKDSVLCARCNKFSIRAHADDLKCTKCPEGQKAARNLFNIRSDRCIPI